MPFRDPHTAAPTLWAIRDSYGEEFEFSYTTPEICQIKRHRKGLEDAIASYATPPDINEKHKRTEVESDLLGAHYLVTGRPPNSQY